MYQRIFFALLSILTNSTISSAAISWTQVDCGGINETLQSSRPFPAGTTKLNYAEFLTLILGEKAIVGWPQGRPMPTNKYINPEVKSVDPLSVPGSNSAYLVILTSANHVPETKVICTLTQVIE